jgi:hypothetical protein
MTNYDNIVHIFDYSGSVVFEGMKKGSAKHVRRLEKKHDTCVALPIGSSDAEVTAALDKRSAKRTRLGDRKLARKIKSINAKYAASSKVTEEILALLGSSHASTNDYCRLTEKRRAIEAEDMDVYTGITYRF